MTEKSLLIKDEVHKLMASQAYRQPGHPERRKIHDVVRKWFVNHYNKPISESALSHDPDSPWKNLGNILLVGEGNLSFARSLLGQPSFGITGIIATTYETEKSLSDESKSNSNFLRQHGAIVMHDIDAAHLEKSFSSQQFNTIIFQFPNVGSREPIHGRNPNFILLRKFLKNAFDILVPQGKVMVSTVNNPHYEGVFQFEEAAKFSGAGSPKKYDFDPALFPGYSHVNTNDDESAIENHKKFVTWVFRKKI